MPKSCSSSGETRDRLSSVIERSSSDGGGFAAHAGLPALLRRPPGENRGWNRLLRVFGARLHERKRARRLVGSGGSGGVEISTVARSQRCARQTLPTHSAQRNNPNSLSPSTRRRPRHNTTTKKVVKGFCAKADGKDKLTALVQYACLFASAGEPGKLRKVQASVTAARKVFRIMRVSFSLSWFGLGRVEAWGHAHMSVMG